MSEETTTQTGNLATGKIISEVDPYQVEFDLIANLPNEYSTNSSSYVVDFILNVEGAAGDEFTLNFLGETFKKDTPATPTGVKLPVNNFTVQLDQDGKATYYFSKIYIANTEGADADNYKSVFTLDRVFTSGAGGKAVATVSNVSGLAQDTKVSLQMIIYGTTDFATSGGPNNNVTVTPVSNEVSATASPYLAKGEITSDTDPYKAEFTLIDKLPGIYDNNKSSYVVDFILNVEGAAGDEFTLNFLGETFKKDTPATPTGVKLPVNNFTVQLDQDGKATYYFSKIYIANTEGADADNYKSVFTLDRVFTSGAGGKAVATVSNVSGLAQDTKVSLQMIIYGTTDFATSGGPNNNVTVTPVSNEVSATAIKPSSGGPSGGGTPVTPPVTPEEPQEPVIPDDKGNAEIKVDEEKADKLVQETVTSGSKTVELINKDNIEGTVTSVTVAVEDLKTISDKIENNQNIDSVSIATSVGEVIIEKEVLTDIIENANAETIVVEVVDAKDKLNEEQKKTVGDNPVYEVNIRAGSEYITSFNGKSITISIPYELKAGEDPNNLVVYHLKDDGTVEKMKGIYKDGKVSFETNHLSKFVIAYEAQEPVTPDTPDEPAKDKDDNLIYYAIAAIVVILIIVALAYYFMRKK